MFCFLYFCIFPLFFMPMKLHIALFAGKIFHFLKNIKNIRYILYFNIMKIWKVSESFAYISNWRLYYVKQALLKQTILPTVIWKELQYVDWIFYLLNLIIDKPTFTRVWRIATLPKSRNRNYKLSEHPVPTKYELFLKQSNNFFCTKVHNTYWLRNVSFFKIHKRYLQSLVE